jgi:hypothetical protein
LGPAYFPNKHKKIYIQALENASTSYPLIRMIGLQMVAPSTTIDKKK